ncbi:hypothetical protein Q3G72_030475 [Acer saccharum]|nr:hypothetical protein Q3G72_030475 [Acer saccharum]
MKKNPVAEKKKRKLQQRWCNNISDDEPCMSSKHSKLVESSVVPIWELNSQHTVSNMVQVWQSIESPVSLVPISDEPSIPIWVQQNQQQDVELIMNSHIAQVLPLETKPEDTNLMDDLFKDIPTADDRLLESDKLMADQTEEAVLMDAGSESTIDQLVAVEIQKAVDAQESSASNGRSGKGESAELEEGLVVAKFGDYCEV